MKALTRNKGETIRKSDGIEGIDWKTGAPLTNPEWCGGPYRLVDNYVEPIDGDGHTPVDVPVLIYDEVVSKEVAEELLNVNGPIIVEDEDPANQPVVTDEYVIIDGVKYRRA